MSTTRASIPRVPHCPRGTLRTLLLGGAFAAVLGTSFLGCTFGWDSYDPRLGSGGAASTGTGGSGLTTGTGGASSSSSAGATSSSASTGATSSGASTADASSSSGVGGASTSSGAGGSSSSSSGTGGAGGGPTHCGGTGVLADDFPGGDPGELWYMYTNGNVVSETGGEAVVALPNNSPTGSWGEFESKRSYDFRGDSVSIDVTSAANPATTAQGWFGLGFQNNYLKIYQQHGFLHFEQQVAGVVTSLKTTAYDPVVHRHWRFREDGVTTYWETSSDGVSWTTMTQVATATLFPMDLVTVWFGGATNGGEVSPGEVHFDQVNGGGAPKEKWCPASSFKDDFNDGVRSPAWARSWEDKPGMLSETGGKLVVTLVPNTTASASYASSSAFDLTSSSVVIEVPSAVSTADGSKTRIALIAPGDHGFQMSELQGQLIFSAKVLDTWQDVGSLLYSPLQHRWWRIRESSNTLYWETSPDGKAWQIQAQLSPVPIPIDALDFYVGSDGWMAQPNPGVSSFDNLNLPPP